MPYEIMQALGDISQISQSLEHVPTMLESNQPWPWADLRLQRRHLNSRVMEVLHQKRLLLQVSGHLVRRTIFQVSG